MIDGMAGYAFGSNPPLRCGAHLIRWKQGERHQREERSAPSSARGRVEQKDSLGASGDGAAVDHHSLAIRRIASSDRATKDRRWIGDI
jgi:hypothetical protein